MDALTDALDGPLTPRPRRYGGQAQAASTGRPAAPELAVGSDVDTLAAAALVVGSPLAGDRRLPLGDAGSDVVVS